MEDSKDFGSFDLNEVRISTLLTETNEEKDEKKEIKSPSNDSELKDKEIIKKELTNNNDKEQKKRIIDNSYDSYVYVYVEYLIQSLISLGYYFLFYKFKFEDDGIKIRICLLASLLLFIFCICYLSRAKFNIVCEKFSNIGLIISINIFKIIFDIIFYLILVSDKENDGIGFSHFEARAYWKFSMSIFYLFLLFYSYFTREKTTLNFYVYLIASGVCLIICFVLILMTQKYTDNIFRIINYTCFIVLELFFVIYSIYFEYKKTKIFHYLDIKINLRVNRIDYLRYGLFIFLAIGKTFKYCTKKCGCCRGTK